MSFFDFNDFANVMFYLGAMISLNTRESKIKRKVCSGIILTIGAIIQLLFGMKSTFSVYSALFLCLIIFCMPTKWAEAIELFFTSSQKTENGIADSMTRSKARSKISRMIIGIILVFMLALIAIAINWYWIKSDQPFQGLIYGLMFSFLGAIAGGLTGGYGSYLGGIEGARRNFDLNNLQDIKQAYLKLYKQLDYTCRIIYYFRKQEYPADKITIGSILYDENWPQQLAMIEKLTNKEFNKIIRWFQKLQAFEADAQQNKGILGKARVQANTQEAELEEIKQIAEKIHNAYKAMNS